VRPVIPDIRRGEGGSEVIVGENLLQIQSSILINNTSTLSISGIAALRSLAGPHAFTLAI
jgi:hypothetical protein